MTSEGILLHLPHVKLKKNEGELYLMTERLGWMVGNKGSFTVSHKYADIKTQKISPEGKAKIQLQVCLHDGNATTFQFVNPEGQAKQLADRDKVKDQLQLLLPKFKRVVNKDLEEKNRLLTENLQLRQLYLELVKSGVITAEEFWADIAAPYVKQQNEAQATSQQETGISPSFLADIKPQTDGSNGSVRYVLTSETMASIFRTYPSVKQKHLKCVPHKMTEEEFWKKFFSSHYLHRDKNILDTKDLFTDCGKQDDQVVKEHLATVKDPLLDLTNLNDVAEEEQPTPVGAPKPSAVTNQNLIRRFNQHSILVLKASEKHAQEGSTEPPVDLITASKRARLEEAVSYEDLETEKPPPAEQLKLSRTERYLTGPPTGIGPSSESNGNGSAAMQAQLDPNAYRNLVLRWMKGGDREYNPAEVLQSVTAIEVLKELSVGGSLMRGAQPHAAIHLPADLQKELKQLYVSLSEIIRHFWAAFPPSTPQLVEKANRMVDSLHRFNQAKLLPFEQKVIQASSTSEADNILKPMKIQIQSALSKYSQFSERRPPRAPVPPM